MKMTRDTKLAYTPQYLTLDGAPYFPVMGEIHYSRVQPERWKLELLKMKAGGVDIVSCYAIWIHHEEIEGQWDFSGCRDLRLFLENVKQTGLTCILRIGPWAHGEVRNGGFPDWLMAKEKEGMVLRSNDEGYISEVKRYYEKLYEEASGYLLKDDGPIIGVQIENEYGHCGGFAGEEGEAHMKRLLSLAKEVGFDVPLYTVTGWGGAVTAGMLPVMGGYCEAPWDQRITEIEPSVNYLYTPERNDHNIGSDFGFGAGITFDMDKYPYLCAELGGGLQVTRHRRPVARAKDIAVASQVKMASGCNLLGYYMYHGGTNPDGVLSTLQESKATGSLNDLPIRSYDFNAPIREYGQLTDTYREIRRLSMFLKDYGDTLAETSYVEQPGNATLAEDMKSRRYAVRYALDNSSRCGVGEGNYSEELQNARNDSECRTGFCFESRFVRRNEMTNLLDQKVTAYGASEELLAEFPNRDVKNGDAFFYPFNLPIGDALLVTCDATPLCILNQGEYKVHVFYTDGEPREARYQIEGDLGKNGILTISDKDALHAVKVVLDGKEYLVISEDDVVEDENGDLLLITTVADEHRPEILIYPEPDIEFKNWKKTEELGKVSLYSYKEILRNESVASVEEMSLAGDEKLSIYSNSSPETTEAERYHTPDDLHYQIYVKNANKTEKYQKNLSLDLMLDETMLYLNYKGNTAEAYCGKKLIADSFYTGQAWEMGVSDFPETPIDIIIHPLYEDTPVFLEDWPELKDGKACELSSVTTAQRYVVKIY